MALFTQKGILPTSDLLKYMDVLAGVLKVGAPLLGLNQPNEAGTVAAKAQAARLAILGDESTAAIRSATIKANVKDSLDALVADFKWDTRFAKYRRMSEQLNSMVSGNLPSTWSFASTNREPPFDLWLQRINGTAAPVAGSPTVGTLTAVTNASGRMPRCLTTQRPYIVHTLVGDRDWKESLPSGNATQVDIAGANNAYSYQIAGTVPAGVYKVRVLRGYYGDASNGPKYYIGEVTVTPGLAYPAILLLLADNELRPDIVAPAWLSCLPTAEFATFFALGYSSAPDVEGLLQYATEGVLSPQNVALIPANGVLGLRNVSQNAEFGISTITGLNTQTYVGGTLQTANNVGGSTQGFGGSLGTATGGLRARVTGAINATGTVTISYGYYIDTFGWGSVQTQTGVVSGAFSGTAVGSTAIFAIPSNRIVVSVSVTAIAGGMNTGSFLIESESPRTI